MGDSQFWNRLNKKSIIENNVEDYTLCSTCALIPICKVYSNLLAMEETGIIVSVTDCIYYHKIED